MQITVPATVQPMSMDKFKDVIELHYNVKAAWNNRGEWTFTSDDIEAMELLIQDLMQLKPMS